MVLKDVNYGSFDVREPVLIELINSDAVQRLKRLDQMGVPQKYYPFAGFSRFEHSLGVMLLLRKLDARLEEQVAGLIHDASHLAFSHTVDWAIAEGMKGNEDLQDNNHMIMLAETTIPKTLKKFGLDFGTVTDIKRFKLLESDAPSLCADRLDYALKEFYYCGSKAVAKQCVEDLMSFDGRTVFRSKEAAGVFGRNYMALQNGHWGGQEAVTQYYLLSRIIKAGLEKQVISFEDLKTDDEYVMDKLEKTKEEEIRNYLRLLLYKGKLPKNKAGKSEKVRKKFRHVDPKYLDNGIVRRLSESEFGYGNLLEESRKLNQKGITIRLGPS
jgi:hypothetical protein